MKVVYKKEKSKSGLDKLKSSLSDIEDMLEDHIVKVQETQDHERKGYKKWSITSFWNVLFS